MWCERSIFARPPREDKEDRNSKLTLTGDLHEDVGTARVQVDKLGQVVDSRVDDDPEVILLIVLWSSGRGMSDTSQRRLPPYKARCCWWPERQCYSAFAQRIPAEQYRARC